MKNLPGKKTPSRMTPAEAKALASKDKRKLILLSVGMLLLLSLFVFSRTTAKNKKAEEADEMSSKMAEQNGPQESEVFVPEFPAQSTLDAISDGKESERVLLDETAILDVLKYAQRLTPAQYDAMGLVRLDPTIAQAIDANPNEYRLQPYWLRGKVVQIHKRAGSDDKPDTLYGTLLADDGTHAHFVVSDKNTEEEFPTDYLRIDGLFVQMHNSEIGEEWVDAPLFISRRLSPSFPPLVLDENLSTPAVDALTDDTIEGTTGIPDAAKWELMAKAEGLKGKVDWETVPFLNDEYIGRMLQSDTTLRGKPFRIPIRVNKGTRTVKVSENPLYRENLMQGWMGDYSSKKANGLIHWIAAIDNPALHDFQGDAKYVTGNGFFLKVWAFPTRDGAPGYVPVFVMQSVDVHTPNPDYSHTMTLWAMLGITLVMLLVISWLLSRDKKQTEALQRRLVERRRARRESEAKQTT